MVADAGGGQQTAVAFESFGVPVRVTFDRPGLAPRIAEILPPDYAPIASDVETETFGLVGGRGGTYTFTRQDSPVSSDLDLEFGLMMLQAQMRIYIGLNAPERIFVHAGAVAVNGRAVVLPGRSFSGKTTLVSRFLEAGAIYLSDEFAVFDSDARVHPYPTSLSVRVSEDERRPVGAVELGSTAAASSVPLGAIIATSYRPGAEWMPAPITRGQASLALLDNTLAALERHTEALQVFRRATDGPLLLAGDRGEPEPLVTDVMSRLS